MILIVGLGNPGKKYQNNRHNVGFQFVDYLIENLKILNPKSQIPNKFQVLNYKFQKDKYLDSEIARLLYDRTRVVLAKPQTFMNNSGLAVKKLATKLFPPNTYYLTLNSLIIVHDDLDVPLGKFHIQFGVGPQLHNGLESIENHLKTKDFWRVRIGVDNRQQKWIDGETYSLQNFLSQEKKLLETEIFPKIFTQLKLNFKML